MTNNDILRRIRYAFDFTDEKMMHLFESGGRKTPREHVSDWLKKEEDPDVKTLEDVELAMFLNGFINDKRGKKEGPQAEPEVSLSNNTILRKLKIALNLKDEDILAILKLADREVSKHEISAFFRHPEQNQYRVCKDQILRNFIQGLQIKHRPST
jgi:uncharacterized protein YehS (DUF1456 family)